MKTSYLAIVALALAGTFAVAAQPAGKKQGNVPRLKISSPDADEPAADDDEDASETRKKPAKKPSTGLKLSTGDKKKAPNEAEVVKNLGFMLGYGVGRQISQFSDLGIKIDLDVVIQALREGAEGKESAMGDEESQEAAQAIQQFVQAKSAAKNKRDGEKFLAENKKEEGVKALSSGLQYKVIKTGKGEKPKKSDTVRVHYKGSFTNGMEFESSYRMGQPIVMPADKFIPGWTEALQLMKVGDKWKLFIPSNLAYGENGMHDRQGNQRIPPNAALVFEIELLGIEKGAKGPVLK